MYKRLQPILNVRNIADEIRFYVHLGFKVAYQVEGFAALAAGEQIFFGLMAAEQSDPAAFEKQMYWQFNVDSIRDLARHCEQEGISIETPITLQAWGEWMLALRSPGGYRVVFEGQE
jgi:catechol 2,3-dioxygenase-like lactoylglutathione lyase family enzyme